MSSDNNNTPWLSPSDALNRFQIPAGMIIDLPTPARTRARYGFRIGDIGLLIDADTVSEVMEPLPTQPLPHTADWLLGLCNLRGNLVPIYDLERLFGLQIRDPHNRMLLLIDEGEKAVGILIDGLPSVPDLSHRLNRIPPIPTMLTNHVGDAYFKDQQIWLEFNHDSFFRALADQVTG